MSKAKPQPGFLPPRVVGAYARLTGTRPMYDAQRDQFDFVDELYPVIEFRKRQRHTGVLRSMFHANQAV